MAEPKQLYEVACGTTFVHELFRSENEPLIFDILFRKNLNVNCTHITNERAIDVCKPALQRRILYVLESMEIPDKPISLMSHVKKETFFGWVERILIFDADQGLIQRFKKEKHIPLKPRQLIPTANLENIKVIEDKIQKEVKYTLCFSFEGEKHEYEMANQITAQLWHNVMLLGRAWGQYDERFLVGDKAAKEIAGQIGRQALLKKGYMAKNIRTKNVNTDNCKDLSVINANVRQRVKSLVKVSRVISDAPPVAPSQQVTIDDFDVLKIIGEGAFGRVYKVRHKESNSMLAMKVLSKRVMLRKNQSKYALIEKKVLAENSWENFLLTLHFSFQSKSNLFMVVDYCPNSDLTILLAQSNEEGLEEYVVRFYGAEILLALEDLHKRDILYRDLKPDNVLLDQDGHARLADFGLAAEKIKNNSTFAKSFCGSPIYLSPELLKKRKTNKISDYYSFGVVLYELLVGDPPFFSENIDGLYRLIKKGKLRFPDDRKFTSEIKDLISKLMYTNPKKRLGFARGIAEIKEHPFFKHVDWVRLKNREIKPPFRFEHDDTVTDSILRIPERSRNLKSTHFNDFEFVHPRYL